jgi:hypothetical protein
VAAVIIKVQDDPFFLRARKLLENLISTTNGSKNAVVEENLFVYRQDLKGVFKNIKSRYTMVFESCDSYEPEIILKLLEKLAHEPKAVGAYAPAELLFDDRNLHGDFIFKSSSAVHARTYSKGTGRSNLLMLTKQYRKLFSPFFSTCTMQKLLLKNLTSLDNCAPLVSWRLTNLSDGRIVPISRTTLKPPELVDVQTARLVRVGQNFVDEQSVQVAVDTTVGAAVGSKKKLKTARKIKLFETSPDEVMNFGDVMSRHLLRNVFGQEVEYCEIDNCEMIAVGSIIEYLLRRRLYNEEPAYIWGSGFLHNDVTTLDFADAKICLLRGELTLARTVNIPVDKTIPLGDPGLIADKLVPQPQKRFKLGIIPHADQTQAPKLEQFKKLEDAVIINPFGNPLEVIKAIAECEYILSSSLHGLICADSYEISNLRLRIDQSLMGGDYKFMDYYSVFEPGRMTTVEIDEILDKNSNSIVALINQHYVQPKNLDNLKSSIINAFPKDLL